MMRHTRRRSMLYVRLSLVYALPGRAEEVARIMDDLVDFYQKQDGYVAGYKLWSADETGDIGRITVWRDLHAADAAAQSNHVLSLRSELVPLIEEGSHEERGFHAEEEGSRLSGLLRKLGI
jgi:hypothetical protein